MAKLKPLKSLNNNLNPKATLLALGFIFFYIMKKLQLYIYMALLTVVCAANTCTCGRKNVNPTYYLTQDAKDYTVFKTGSKWVYKNGNKNDTIALQKEETVLSQSKSLGYIAEIYNSHLKSSYYEENLQYNLANMGKENLCSALLGYNSKPFGFRHLFVSGVELGQTWNGSVIYKSHYNNYLVGGIIYNDVREFTSTLQSENGGADTDSRVPKSIWYARHVGIIKKELPNGEVWNLIAHEVKQ